MITNVVVLIVGRQFRLKLQTTNTRSEISIPNEFNRFGK